MATPPNKGSEQGRQPLPRWKWVKMRPSMPPDDIEDVQYHHLLCFQCLNSQDLFRDTVHVPSSSLPVWASHAVSSSVSYMVNST